MRIDAHHHFWHYTTAEYGWIDDDMAALRRDFLPPDLEREIARAGMDGVVSVQARQTLEETAWLLGLAAKHNFIKGVVGWVELANPDVGAALAQFASNPKLKGIRHVVQGEPDDNFILGPDFNRGVAQLAKFGLVYDILIFPKQLQPASQFVDRHPGQVFVLDHIAKPPIKTGGMEPWATQIRELAQRPNVYCKISGMVTEADYQRWNGEQLRTYFEVVLAAFGPRRLMFGSDWPVCLAACDYSRWQQLVADWISKLSAAEQARILGGTAVEAYGLQG